MAYIYDYTGKKIDISGAVAETVEPGRNDVPIVTITGELYATKADGDSNVTIQYKSATKEFTAYATAKVQGDSSQAYPKKNYTIKLFSDSARTKKYKMQFKDWDKARNKFVLKANWIDHSHARNIVNARLWRQVVESRSDYSSLPSELKSGNKAIDGFPVKVYNNGVYMGLYTWNLPKDAMYGVDSDIDENCIMQSEGNLDNESMLFWAPTMNDKWSDELHDSMPTVIANGWTAVLQFVSSSTSATYKTGIQNYFDVQSMIDEHIFVQVIYARDNIAKNQTFFTYDAQKWYTGMYDMDGTWGLRPINVEQGWGSPQARFQNDYGGHYYGSYDGNLRHNRITEAFATEVQARYSELRQSVLSEDNICSEFDKFISAIPPYLYEEDYAETTGGGLFTGIPLVSENNILQIRDFVVKRLAYVDENLK